jgi:hypothetical protein
MKRIIISLVATALVASAAVFAYSKTSKKDDCCKEGSACCFPGSACCVKK